jgi:hypothetical protein
MMEPDNKTLPPSDPKLSEAAQRRIKAHDSALADYRKGQPETEATIPPTA